MFRKFVLLPLTSIFLSAVSDVEEVRMHGSQSRVLTGYQRR
jgi:hypothetical protein